MADITWTEGEGSEATTLSLGSPRPDPANRFFECVPNYLHVGPRRVAMTRAIHAFTFREDYTLRLVMKHLAPSQLALAQALKKHLMTGGAVTANTDDLNDASYDALTLAPGSEPEIRNADDEQQYFEMEMILAGDEPMAVDYDG